MNPTFGASILSWIPPMWTPEGGLFAIRKHLPPVLIYWKSYCLLPWSSTLQP